MIAHENSADLITHENRITLALTSEATGNFVDRLLSAGSEWSASRRPRHAGRVCSPERDRSPPAAALTCDQRFAFPWSLTLRMCCGASNSRSEEHTSELQSQSNLVCRLLLEKKKKKNKYPMLISKEP